MIWPHQRLSSALLASGWLTPSCRFSLPRGLQYLPVELGDDSVVVGVNTCPQQGVSLLVQAAQVFVGAPGRLLRGGWVRTRGGGGRMRGGGA